jgi:hypothetical protein
MMSSLTGNRKVFILAVLAAGFAVASVAITMPVAAAQNATNSGGNMTTPGGNMTTPGGNMTTPGGNMTTPGGNMTQ